MGRKRKATEALVTSARDVLQHWTEYYTNQDFGIGIMCVECQKWRLTYQYQESKDVPADWTCSMWQRSKKKRGNCNIPSNLTEDDFAQEEYPPGTLVWAKLGKYPEWPAMIEDSPDTQEFFAKNANGEEVYHVTFFGEKPNRSWIKSSHIRAFDTLPPVKPKKSTSLKKSIEEAQEAAQLPLKERLKKYSFAVRYKGRWARLNKVKDDISLPPTCSVQKRLAEPTDVKSPATKDEGNELPAVIHNRHANGNHPTSLPLAKEGYCRLEKKITPVDKYENIEDDGISAKEDGEDADEDDDIEEDDYEDSEVDDIMSFDPEE